MINLDDLNIKDHIFIEGDSTWAVYEIVANKLNFFKVVKILTSKYRGKCFGGGDWPEEGHVYKHESEWRYILPDELVALEILSL